MTSDTKQHKAHVQPETKKKRNVPRTTVVIDESGQMGISLDKYYVMCAERTKKRKELEECTSRYHFLREMKFRKNHKQRKEVVKDVGKLKPVVCATLVKRPFIGWHGNLSKHEVHERSLDKLAKKAIGGCKAEHIDVLIDQTSMIDDKRACDICKKYGKGRDIRCKVVDSSKSYAMQTHDFVVGSVAKKYNKNDETYLNLLGVHIQVRNVSPKNKQ